jgi:hypothetical protein
LFGFILVVFLKVRATPPEIYCATPPRCATEYRLNVRIIHAPPRHTMIFFYRAPRPKILPPRHAAPPLLGKNRARARVAKK